MADPARSEPATPRRRQEARERGQVAKSQEIVAALVLLATFAILSWTGERLYAGLSLLFQRLWGANPYPVDFTPSGLQDGLIAAVAFFWLTVGPLLLGGWIVAVLANVVQFGVVFSGHPIRPKLSNLDPFQGFQRVFSQRMLFELAKSLVKLIVLATVGYLTIQAEWGRLVHGSSAGTAGVLLEISRISVLLGLRIAGVLLLLAGLDYGFQRWQFEKSIRMTRQEIRDELRQLEGDPLIKARIRQIQREMARRRMFEEIPKADVIITNPEHLALALRYEGAKMSAPRVVAKGQGLVAQRIGEIGRAHGILVVENVPLAQALYKATRVGDEIPPALYQAVAEVIAYVYQATRRESLLSPGATALTVRK